MRIYLNDDWKFTTTFIPQMCEAAFDDSALASVRLPHTMVEVPFHYFDESAYQVTGGYRRILHAPADWAGKHVLLTIDGAAHYAEVFLNGVKIASHANGYTAFTVDLAPYLTLDADNVLVVMVDSHETLNQPPFGFVIDYMTFGGLTREVWLDVKEASYIEDVFVHSLVAVKSKRAKVTSEITLAGEVTDGLMIRQSIRRKGEEAYAFHCEGAVSGKRLELTQIKNQIELWELDHPVLYEVKTELISGEKVLDEVVTVTGFRSMHWRADGFYLNHKKVKIRGLDRHQSYAYVGYAMPQSMQERDADLLKFELGCNAVRTSHYPQSHHFMNRCDEIGLLVFTEIPGWQHIGDLDWQDLAVENVREMVLQYRNHPSIMLWGVRINESNDNDAFYMRTNAAARELDPTRATGGVRCITKSHLLEDVYTYNDFSHDGEKPGCQKKSKVTPDMKKAYLVTEYAGHMYPTKNYDAEEHRLEHLLRHVRVLDAIAGENDIAGSFGWCMFDYNTHRDFGSGDRICYHGVMDMFRNEKLAAKIYAAQQDDVPVLELTSSMDIGEHPASNRGEVYILTNADFVRMYKNDRLLKTYTQEDSQWQNLKHAPIAVDDYIGNAILENENFKPDQAKAVKEILNAAARYGMNHMPKSAMLQAAKAIGVYHMSFNDAVALHNKYIGDWGGAATSFRLEAVKDGRVVATVVKQPSAAPQLTAEADHTVLTEKTTYDVAAVRIQAKDEFGNVLPFANDPVKLTLTGAAELIGPDVVSLHGGMSGTYVKTTGEKGEAKLVIESAFGEPVEITFEVK
ncbi:MAG: glycoside hydrolase family 2 protein [Lachnospiraceae bacterium]|nr:glycoside hydrolase family 2 protein [Lachnospiraceae bacterium]